MSIRQPCARNFYVGECSEKQIERYLEGFQVPDEPSEVVGGIVPHAGWVFSGAVAAKVFKCIKEKSSQASGKLEQKSDPDTFILFGAVHRFGVRRNSVHAHGYWYTPLGEVEVDDDVAASLLSSLKRELVESPDAHLGEHSLEVQLPFIKYFFPQARIVPVAIVPEKESASTGQKIGEFAAECGKEIVVVGTTDLTHYGDNYGFTPQGYGPNALEWMRENDSRIIDLALNMRADDIVQEAMRNHNACGSGAMAATVSAAKAMGAEKGILIEYTTSHDVSKEGSFYMGVGYAGIVF